MTKILVAGIDGSLRNFGVARMIVDTQTLALSVDNLHLITTEKSKIKTVRSSSDNLARAQSIHRGATSALAGCTAAFAEVPSGGQSYDAVLGFGIVIGIYASIQIPLLEVSPSETKLATVGTRVASKQEMIEWAAETYPDAPWLRNRGKATGAPTLANEHLADACAIVHAGIRTPAFKQVLAILNAGSPIAA
jgi:Holliday junction resolvasome RuvABC endonuclease subunit